MHGKRTTLSMAATLLLISMPAAAYVGPGAGLSLLAALWGLVVAIGIALCYVLIWPIRRWRHRRQSADDEVAELPAEVEITASVDPPRDHTSRGQ